MAESFSREKLSTHRRKKVDEKSCVTFLLCDPGRRLRRLGRAGIRRFRPRVGHQNSPFRGYDYMIPYMGGKLAPNSSHLTRGLVKYVRGRGYFRAVSSQNGDKCVTSPPLPNR